MKKELAHSKKIQIDQMDRFLHCRKEEFETQLAQKKLRWNVKRPYSINPDSAFAWISSP
jgi:hypothetical protein